MGIAQATSPAAKMRFAKVTNNVDIKVVQIYQSKIYAHPIKSTNQNNSLIRRNDNYHYNYYYLNYYNFNYKYHYYRDG